MGEIGSLILAWTAQTVRLTTGCRSSKRGRSGAHDPAMPFPVLLPYGEVEPKASSSCFLPIWPSEESPKFPARLPSDFEPGRVVFKASRQPDHGSTEPRAHDAGTIPCPHPLLRLGREEGALPPLPLHKPLWPRIIRHLYASFPPELQVCTPLVTPGHVPSQDTFPAEPALSDRQNALRPSLCAAISRASAGSPRSLIFKRRGTVLEPKVLTTRSFPSQSGAAPPRQTQPRDFSVSAATDLAGMLPPRQARHGEGRRALTVWITLTGSRHPHRRRRVKPKRGQRRDAFASGSVVWL